MRKVFRKIIGYVLFVPTMLWFIGLFISGLICSVRNLRAEMPGMTVTEALMMTNENAITDVALTHIYKAFGREYKKEL